MAHWLVVADFHDLCGEGPLWDQRRGLLFWTDITGKRFYRYDWHARKAEVLHAGWEISGFALNEPEGFLVVNSEGIWTWDGGNRPTLLANQVEGFSCRMNDCVADPVGRLLAGSQFYDADRLDYPLGHLMRMDCDGTVHILDEGIRLSNGLGFSPDGRVLYFVDSAARTIFAYDYDVTTGTTRRRRPFVQTTFDEGLPDGLTVDADGFVWSAHWFGSCIVRYDPDGKVERRISVPAKQTSSLAFGGPELADVFVTSAALVDSLPLAPSGYDPAEGNIGGQLFLANLGVAGKEEFRCRIRLEAP
jgi:sugar lactone lactonase YvrE